ncbi:MAG: hypothetical protein ACYCX0_10240, partial [Desulfurivibrionaceae bacterium]
MNRSVTNIVLALCLSPLLMQCAAEKDVRGLDMRLRTADSKITDMENTLTAMKNQRGSQAELASQFEQIKS